MPEKSIRDRIAEDMRTAMKSGAALRLGVLRMLKARMMEAEVALRGSRGREHQLEDSEAIAVLASYAKQRRDSIDSYRQAGREDLVAQEEAELAIIQEYLPRQLGDEEIRKIVKEAIDQAGATSPKDMGAVMKLAMPRLKGTADGKVVSRIAGELLSGGRPA